MPSKFYGEMIVLKKIGKLYESFKKHLAAYINIYMFKICINIY